MYLRELWELQGGKCYYTNLYMVGNGISDGCQAWDSPSIDRLVPQSGYVVGNVVWCISSVNSFKSTLTEKQFASRLKCIDWKI